MKKIILAVVLISSSLLTTAQTKVGDATLANTITFETESLYLNGAGIREKFWFDIYACGLYLKKKSSSATEILIADEPMALHIETLSGLLSKKKMIGAFEDGFKKTNSEATQKKLEKEFNTFLGFLSQDIEVGDKYDLVYTTDSGLSLYKNNKKIGNINSLAFKTAIFNIWLSRNSVDNDLKDELLSK